MTWTAVCKLDDIPPNAGVAALVNGQQIAIFKVKDEVFAVDNHDPFSRANVLSRGIVGSIADQAVVASPMYKQHFALATGVCLEDSDQSINIYPVRISGDAVLLSLAALAAA